MAWRIFWILLYFCFYTVIFIQLCESIIILTASTFTLGIAGKCSEREKEKKKWTDIDPLRILLLLTRTKCIYRYIQRLRDYIARLFGYYSKNYWVKRIRYIKRLRCIEDIYVCIIYTSIRDLMLRTSLITFFFFSRWIKFACSWSLFYIRSISLISIWK